MTTLIRRPRRAHALEQVLKYFALSCLWLGCSVDDRMLSEGLSGAGGGDGGAGGTAHPGSAGTGSHVGGDAGDTGDSAGAGDSAGTRATAGSAGVAGAAGTAGSGGASGGTGGSAAEAPIVCSDSDPQPGCVQSLASNATFDTDAAHWTPDPGSTQNWVVQDADQRASSGALAVLNDTVDTKDGSVVAGSGQCLAVTAGDTYNISARVFMAGDQGSTGFGGFYASLYASADCSGAALSFFGQSTLPDAIDVWSTAHMAVDTSPQNLSTAQSMSLRMIAQKAFSAAPLTVLFDDVLVQKAMSP